MFEGGVCAEGEAGAWVACARSTHCADVFSVASAVLLFCCIGLFSIHNDRIDVFIGAIFGLLGYAFSRMRCELAPMLLGFILGPLLEENLRRALLVSLGDPLVLLQRPISGTFLVLTLLLVVALALPGFQGFRRKAFVES